MTDTEIKKILNNISTLPLILIKACKSCRANYVNVSGGVYVLFQNNCKYEEEKSFCVSNTKEYLQITTDNIMLDDEAYDYLETMKNIPNREVLVIDTNMDYEGNTPVYVF